jgi:uncharacterized protein
VAENVCNVATLYPQYFQIVANADSGIESIEDARGKSMAIQPVGNTAEFDQRSSARGLRPDLRRSRPGQLRLLHRRRVADEGQQRPGVHARHHGAGLGDHGPGLVARHQAHRAPDDKFEAMRELNPGYTKLTIPAGSYPGQDEDVDVVGYATHVIARCDLDEDVVYKILEGHGGTWSRPGLHRPRS